MEEHDILTALDNQQFAIWLQPQVDAPAARSAAPKCCCVSGRRMAAGRYRRR
jgi:EAL domain-containing protein (putative c-di-GMP-specific phosphodiesterase class I)